MKFSSLLSLFILLNIATSKAQETVKDSTKTTLDEVIIFIKEQTPDRLPSVQNQTVLSGKKNDVLRLSEINANRTTNNARELFSRMAGVSVWENDGSGIQLNIAVRGLSPNRSWELNTRQNGYDISSDVFGYPEAYYNPPMEAVDRIEFIRGGASLQFGPQFGGMINYILKKAPEKKFSFETQNTVGSFGLLSSFNALGGKQGKFSYYAYNHSRQGNGWRDNSAYTIRNSHVNLGYDFSNHWNLHLEYTNMDYEQQQSGGLTDAQFVNNSQQSLRNRNWMGTPWNLIALKLNGRWSPKVTTAITLFGLYGERNSVGFTAAPTVVDAVNPTTLQYANRQVDRDRYVNYGLESRNIWKYSLGKNEHHLAFGLRVYQAKTNRKQRGTGTTGSDFDLSVSNDYPRDLDFTTQNIAAFAENLFQITQNWSVTPGVRFEHIQSEGSGVFNRVNGVITPFADQTITRNQFLLGVGSEYRIGSTNFYTNLTQAYRPVLFSDLTPPATTDVIDNNLKDANGHTFDLGYRGTYKNWANFDVSYFYMAYNNRIGTVNRYTNDDPTQAAYAYRTNLGKSIHRGFEIYADISWFDVFGLGKKWGKLKTFASSAFIHARYGDFQTTTVSGTAPNTIITTTNLAGKRVENAPSFIHNFGISWEYKKISISAQQRQNSAVYSDATNTETPTANGVNGKISSYKVVDLGMEYRFKNYNLKAGINNLLNEKYATRRSGGYPGPGLIPGEGQSFYLSLGAKF
ncbi:MAG: ABC-type iron(III) dicitrate-transport system component, TonB-dependent outer rane receptor FecA [Bacteroidota bacterium]|jgi:Fe(3+) dicitrate transport protein